MQTLASDARFNEQPARAVCAVVVTYYPADNTYQLISDLLTQVARVIVVDNGSPVRYSAWRAPLVTEKRVLWVDLERNRGIAHALNVAAHTAHAAGYRWLLCFDQDSQLPQRLVALLLAAHRAYPAPERVAIVAPLFYDQVSGYTQSIPCDDVPYTLVKSCITSGSLLNLTTFAALEPFDEGFFIDYVDHDFCLRARSRGYAILQVCQPHLPHRLGTMTRHLWGMTTSHHAAARRYYTFRNRMVVYRRHLGFDPGWIARDMLRCVTELLKILLFEEHKGRKLRFALTGIWHGLRGRLGPLDIHLGQA